MKANCSFLSLSYISHDIFSEKVISGVREGGAVMHFQKTIRQLLRGERGGGGGGWDICSSVESIYFNKITLTFIKKGS